MESADSRKNVCSFSHDFNRRFTSQELTRHDGVVLEFWERDRFINPDDDLGVCALIVPAARLADAVAAGSYATGTRHCAQVAYSAQLFPER